MHLLHLASTLSFVSLALAGTTYIVPHSGGGDDTPALTKAFAENPSLATDSTILFKQGVTYNILTPIKFPRFKNVLVSVQGNLTFSADIKATQNIVKSSSYPGAWIKFSGGTNVKLSGSSDPSWGWINGHGQQWWDAKQTTNRPHSIGFNSITNGEFMHMKITQPVAQCFSVSGSNIHVHDNTVKAISTSKNVAANTDAFDTNGSDILFEDNTVYNSDDCLAINSPATNIRFRSNYCNGGHGVSVGSLGKNGAVANVQNVLIEDVVMENSVWGARFKSWAGGKGLARNVTWKGINMKKVRYPIYVTQRYWDKNVGPKPDSTPAGSTQIENFTFQDIHGTLDDSKGSRDVVVLDLFKGTTKGIVVKDVHITAVSGKPVTVACDPATISYDVGFECSNGVYKPTAIGA